MTAVITAAGPQTLFDELETQSYSYALSVEDLRNNLGRVAMRKGRDNKPDILLKAVKNPWAHSTPARKSVILGSWIGSDGRRTKFQKISNEAFRTLLNTGADYFVK